MLAGLRKQQSTFAQSQDDSEAAVKASYLIASKIALVSKLYSDGEFVKTYMMKAAQFVYPEKRHTFANSCQGILYHTREDFGTIGRFR